MPTTWRIANTPKLNVPVLGGDFGNDFGDDFSIQLPQQAATVGTIWRIAGQQDFIIPPMILSGAIVGQAALSGNIAITVVDRNLVGNVSGHATIAGTVVIGPAAINLVGNIAGTGTLAGGLTIGAASPVLFTYDFIATPSLPGTLSDSRATVATYIDTTGTRQMASANVGRFDTEWNGSTWAMMGLRVEEQRTNGVGTSEDGSMTFNNVTNCAWSSSSTPGADNSTNMKTITANAGVAFTDTSFATTQGSGINLFDIDFKKSNWNYVYIDHITGGGNSYTAVFDLVNGTVTDSFTQGIFVGSGPGTIRHLRNGIYKCGIRTNQGGGFLVIGLAQQATGNTFDSAGHVTGANWTGTENVLVGSIMADGALTNVYHASHIVSAGGAVTRSADLISASGTLATQLAGGPSVWEMEDLVSGTISRTQYTNGAFTFPANKRYRSFGVYPNGTNTTPYTTVGGPY